MMHFTQYARVLCTCLGTGLVTLTVGAQTPAPAPVSAPAPGPGSLSGKVTARNGEIQGAPLPFASVTLVSLATGTRRTTSADLTGRFSFNGVPAGGPYILQVQQPGFQAQTITNMFLKADGTTALDVNLNPATVAVGTRRDDRTALESAVPVDVVDVATLLRTVPQTDLSQLLHYSVASFNSTRQTAAGGSDHVDPSNLRGLGTDQMLVLVNGKRRHTTALVNLLSNRGLGSVGTDLNTLPGLGVERVEVLRDGAAAQYGSDAIAGVMNISLKNSDREGSVLLNTGLTTEGDGLATLLGINQGFRLGAKGFLNLTADADYRDRTARGYARDARVSPVFVVNDPAREQAALAASGRSYEDFAQRNGDARVSNVRGLLNARVEASDRLAFYGFGGYNFRRGQASTLWVLPATQSPDIVESLFPFGYQPQVNTRLHDGAGTLGVVLGQPGPNRWTLDVSNTTGYNRMTYDLENTLNATLGASSPTVFDNAGGFQFFQNVTNATANRFFDQVLAGTNVAFGAEFRADRYQILRGDERTEAEYDLGKPASQQGAQGFSGFGEASAVVGSRTNVGAFLDVEADVTKRWSVSGALRYENYSTFGSAFIYKATTRVQATKFLALRGAFNTGFRAPSLQQVLYRQITQRPGVTGVVYAGIFNNQDELRVQAGVPDLTPERSRSVSGGLVLTPGSAFSFTADAYLIDIDDRITLSGLLRPGFGISPDLTQTLANSRVSQAQFFTNDLDTRTQGVDLVASYRHAFGAGQFSASAAGNFTRTRTRRLNVPATFRSLQEDDNSTTNYVDPRQLSLIETGNPASKILLSLNYTRGKLGLGLRNTYFGEVRYYDVAPDPAVYDFGGYLLVFRPRTVTDLLVSLQATKGLSVTLGAQNLFNVKPNTLDQAASNGQAPGGFATRGQFEQYFQNRYGAPSPFPTNRDVYPYAPVQMGFNGALLYLKAVYSLGL
ncbi:TonB-dependent receptor [Hymenobacter sp. BT683]|uniref:TonB-dependent receptor n=1 Tax=Hymenobacter jeongseonensis TaxID=2791027 RepID=A0ABS0IID4_9BACT|nr:TonB-dependent receptor [Hymenobacter jeongseonensis]MBF9238096.1 TonB-dependent receptor [Hymenobacter jeongseonensis]